MSLNDIIENNALLRPDAPAISFNGVSHNFSEHAQRIRKLVSWLTGVAGVGPQQRVAILSQNSSEYVECYGVAEVSDIVLVTLNYRLSPSELIVILDDCRPTVMIFASEFEEVVQQLKGVADYITHYLCIGKELPWSTNYETAIADSSVAHPTQVPDETVAYLIYTSGSTGKPKGVILTHGGQIAAAQTLASVVELSPRDKLLLSMPLYHLGGRSVQMAHHLAGASVLIHNQFEPGRFCRDVQQQRITTTLLAPTMIMSILDLPDIDRFDLSSLRTVIYSAAPMPVALLRRAIARFGNVFMQLYGLTESGPLGTVLKKEDHVMASGDICEAHLSSAGRAIPGCAIRIESADGVEAPVGSPGEILIDAPSLMAGYWNDGPATKAALRDGWLHTGDVGILDADGFVFIIDRIKDMIVSGGENIYPREVEVVLHMHPAIMDAAVIGVPHPKWGETVKAIVVCRPGAAVTEAEVIAYCRVHIASYKKPTSVDFVDALPRLPNGKVNKPVLRNFYWASETRRVS